MTAVRTRSLLGVTALLAAGPLAAETTRTFEVAARIVPGCTVATDAGGRWGTVALGSTPGATAATVEATLLSTLASGLSIECTPSVTAALTADAGDHPSGGERYLARTGGGGTVRYRLYADGGTTPWTGAALPLAFAGGPRVVPVRAVATVAGPTAAGSYTDTVRVTLSW